jgi:hypothetical protein
MVRIYADIVGEKDGKVLLAVHKDASPLVQPGRFDVWVERDLRGAAAPKAEAKESIVWVEATESVVESPPNVTAKETAPSVKSTEDATAEGPAQPELDAMLERMRKVTHYDEKEVGDAQEKTQDQ